MSEEENQTNDTEEGAEETAESKEASAKETTEQQNLQQDNPTNETPESEQGDKAEIIAKSISGKDVNIDALLKVPVSLAIEVGRTKMNMSDLLETREGSVIELDRHLDEPLDILVNGALIAHGVVVLANEKFGLQITDIISLEERARSL